MTYIPLEDQYCLKELYKEVKLNLLAYQMDQLGFNEICINNSGTNIFSTIQRNIQY